MSMGPDALNGIWVLGGGVAATAASVPVLAGLGLSWVAHKSRPPGLRPMLWLALGNALLVVLASVLLFDTIGPRVPWWIDLLGLVWLLAFALLTVLVLRRFRREPAVP